MNDLVFVHYNMRLKLRHDSRMRRRMEDDEKYNPINLDYIFDEDDPLNPWMQEMEEPVLENIQSRTQLGFDYDTLPSEPQIFGPPQRPWSHRNVVDHLDLGSNDDDDNDDDDDDDDDDDNDGGGGGGGSGDGGNDDDDGDGPPGYGVSGGYHAGQGITIRERTPIHHSQGSGRTGGKGKGKAPSQATNVDAMLDMTMSGLHLGYQYPHAYPQPTGSSSYSPSHTTDSSTVDSSHGYGYAPDVMPYAVPTGLHLHDPVSYFYGQASTPSSSSSYDQSHHEQGAPASQFVSNLFDYNYVVQNPNQHSDTDQNSFQPPRHSFWW